MATIIQRDHQTSHTDTAEDAIAEKLAVEAGLSCDHRRLLQDDIGDLYCADCGEDASD